MVFRFILLLGLISISFIHSAAQNRYFNTRTVRKGQDFSFPIFSRAVNDPVTTKINRFLQLTELYFLAKPPYSNNIFNQSKANDGSIYGGKVGLKATVYSNNGQLLSLGFNESACGATCGYWNQYYTFNSGNGDRLSLKDIFETNGYKKFFNTILNKRSVKYRREVKRKVEPRYQESYLGTLGCFENDDLSDFYILGKSIVIDGDSCLIKSQKFDGLDMTVAIDLSEYRNQLNRYGRALFGVVRSDIARFRSRELPQLFEGTVNASYPIVMVLNREFERDYRGFYAYLKYGEAISITGSETDSRLELTERILSPTVTNGPLGEIRKAIENGYITGRLTEMSFEGEWMSVNRTKTLSFTASIN